jgi:large subunit ribosomal protein L35
VGVLPAYDEAVKLIRTDAWAVRREANAQRREVQRLHRVLSGQGAGEAVEGGAKRALEADLEAKRAKLHILDVQSEVNLPEVRWSVANAMADMRIPSHRHLLEQRWRKDGDLDLLMERLHQMKVVPDVLPVLHPSVDLHVTARLMPEHFESLMKRNRFQRRVNTFKEVVPGNYLTPRQVSAFCSRRLLNTCSTRHRRACPRNCTRTCSTQTCASTPCCSSTRVRLPSSFSFPHHLLFS